MLAIVAKYRYILSNMYMYSCTPYNAKSELKLDKNFSNIAKKSWVFESFVIKNGEQFYRELLCKRCKLWIALERKPTVTLGCSAKRKHILWHIIWKNYRGISCVNTHRTTVKTDCSHVKRIWYAVLGTFLYGPIF